MKILIFTEGTILMHKAALGRSREEIIQQVKEAESSVNDYAAYIPIGKATETIQKWVNAGHKIAYVTSRKNKSEINAIMSVLSANQFPESDNLNYRQDSESYADVVERVMPDILIEDDCESIGKDQIIFYSLSPSGREEIKSIIVREFEGIDHTVI